MIMFTIPDTIVLADAEWLPLLQGRWVSGKDLSFVVTDDVMQGRFGSLMPYGPVKFHVGFYEFNKNEIILIPEHARDFDNYGGFAFPRFWDDEIYLRMLMNDAVMGFYFTRPGQEPKGGQGSGRVFRQVMGPAAVNQSPVTGTMGPAADAPKFCRHCGSPVKPGDNFCRQCGGKLKA
jgi:hypothetical protein